MRIIGTPMTKNSTVTKCNTGAISVCDAVNDPITNSINPIATAKALNLIFPAFL